jgi:DNA-binding Lrp family transcriptional regulator
MKRSNMDRFEKILLTEIQSNFPLEPKPFKTLAVRLDSTEDEVIKKIGELIDARKVTRVGAVFNAKTLGYDSALVVTKVEDEKIDDVAEIINSYTGVTHNYVRDAEFNMWFTVTAFGGLPGVLKILEEMKEKTGLKLLPLYSRKKFKINTAINLTGETPKVSESQAQGSTDEVFTFSDNEKALIRELGVGIPIVSEPFLEISKKVNIEVDEIIKLINYWRKKHIARKFSALVRPSLIGLSCGALGVWRADESELDRCGKLMAGYKQISHCYDRIPVPEFNYNIYTMIHGESKDDLNRVAAEISEKTKISDFKLLYTVRELKKKSMKYFS